MPMPSMPGGHQPAPIVGTVLMTQSMIESDGFSMTNLLFASDPPPLAATVTSTVSPLTSETLHHAGRVIDRVAAGEGGVAQDAAAQLVVRVEPGAAHAFVAHLLERQAGVAAVVRGEGAR